MIGPRHSARFASAGPSVPRYQAPMASSPTSGMADLVHSPSALPQVGVQQQQIAPSHATGRGPGVARYGQLQTIQPSGPTSQLQPFRPELGQLLGSGRSIPMGDAFSAARFNGLGQGGIPSANAGGFAGSGGTPGTMGATVAETAAQQVTGEGSSDYTSYLQQLAPLVQAGVEAVSDPYQRVAILQQRLVTMQQIGLPANNWMVRRTQAQLQAAQRKLSIQEEGLQSTREWRGLGKAGIATAVVAGIGLTVLLGVLASAVSRPRRVAA